MSSRKQAECRFPYESRLPHFKSRNKSIGLLQISSFMKERVQYGKASYIEKKQIPCICHLFFWCPRPDSNRHGIATDGFWVRCVYQFHHSGDCLIIIAYFFMLCNLFFMKMHRIRTKSFKDVRKSGEMKKNEKSHIVCQRFYISFKLCYTYNYTWW